MSDTLGTKQYLRVSSYFKECPIPILLGWVSLLIIGQAIGCMERPAASKKAGPSTSTPDTSTKTSVAGATELAPMDTKFDPSNLVRQSAVLTRQLLAGDVAAAHEQFSPSHRDPISLDEIGKLSNELRVLFGNDVSKINLLETRFGEIDAVSQAEAFQVQHIVEFSTGKEAISTVQFSLPAEEASPDSGELVAIDVRETWPSFSPETLLAAKTALQLLFSDWPNSTSDNSVKSTRAENSAKFLQLLHPDTLPYFHAQPLEHCVEQIEQYFGPVTKLPQWSQWSYQTDGEQLTARGIVETKLDKVEIQADFSDQKLIGLTFIGLNCALSTLDLLVEQPLAASRGTLFWENVFRGELAKAHGLLAPEFQQELALNEFQSAISASDLAEGSELKNVHLETIRFSNRMQRAAAFGLTAYYMAKFDDGSQQAVQCEFANQDNSPQLLAFANDFEAILPTSEDDRVETIVNAFLSGEPEQIEQLLDSAGKNGFDAGISKVFMQQLKSLLGSEQPTIEDVRVLHWYREANRTEQLRAKIETTNRSIIFEATTQGGELKSFNFTAPELMTFASAITDISGVEESGKEFIRQWMNPSRTEQAIAKMVGTTDRRTLLVQLEMQRDSLIEQHGRFLWSDLTAWQISPINNEIHVVYDLEFADRTLEMQLLFQVSAIGAKVATASVLTDSK